MSSTFNNTVSLRDKTISIDRIGSTHVNSYHVSTVCVTRRFVWIDGKYDDAQQYETCIFKDGKEVYEIIYINFDDALDGHNELVEKIKHIDDMKMLDKDRTLSMLKKI